MNLAQKLPNSYSWWRQALLGHFGPIHENDPQPGYYRMRKGRGGRWVPAAIWEDKDKSCLSCLVDCVERDAFEVWTWSAGIRFLMRPMWRSLNGVKPGPRTCRSD